MYFGRHSLHEGYIFSNQRHLTWILSIQKKVTEERCFHSSVTGNLFKILSYYSDFKGFTWLVSAARLIAHRKKRDCQRYDTCHYKIPPLDIGSIHKIIEPLFHQIMRYRKGNKHRHHHQFDKIFGNHQDNVAYRSSSTLRMPISLVHCSVIKVFVFKRVMQIFMVKW